MKYASQEEIQEIKIEIDEVKGIVFDIKDNHLKCIDDKVTRLDERTKLILILTSAVFGSIVLGILGTFLLKVCFNLAI